MSSQQYSLNNTHNKQQQYQEQQQQNQYQLLNPQQVKQLHQLPVQQSQSDNDDQDILDKIDSLLLQNQSQSNNTGQNQHNKYQQREMLLNFKITQLQKIINNLNMANKKMKNQLQQYHSIQQNHNNNNNNKNNDTQSNNNSNILNNSNTSQSPFTDQLTQMHGQFQQIQHLITQYKQQLAVSQKKWNTIKQEKDQQIQSLKSQLITISQSRDLLQGEMQKLIQENDMLKGKNQQLLIEIDNLEMQLDNNNRRQQQQQNYIIPSHQHQQHQYHPQSQQQPSSPRYYQTPRKFDQFQDYRFNEKIQRQMQIMIKKLLKQLSNQRKINSRMSLQIKRLNNEVIELQRKIKMKNDAIYQLEMKIIQMEKHFTRNTNNTYSNANISNVNKQHSYMAMKNTPLTPSQNKNQSRVYTNKYQSRTNPQQQKLKGKEEVNNMKDYQGNQYTDQSDRNNYDDYVVTSIPLKGSRSPPKSKLQYTNLINIPQSQNNQSSNMSIQPSSKFPQSHNFIKPKKLQQPKSKNINNPSSYQQRQQNDKSLNRQFMAFTLMQLQEGKIKITMKQKIIIISKLIELYCKKIRTQNYQNLSAEEIQIYNFNEKHPNLVRIRVVNSTASKTDISTGLHEENEESLMYNLAFIVESLVKDVQTIDRQDLELDLNLSEIIEEILNKNMEEKIAYFQQLSKSLENSVLTLV